MVEFVVDVDQQDQIDAGGFQAAVGDRAEDRANVLDPLLRKAGLEQIEHLRLDVGRQDPSLLPDHA